MRAWCRWSRCSFKKSAPALYSALGIYLPLITTNCAVLGVCILNIGGSTTLANGMVVEYNLLYSVLNGVFGALGFLLAIVLMAGVRERLESSAIPKPLRGFSISLIIAGLMSIAFMASAAWCKGETIWTGLQFFPRSACWARWASCSGWCSAFVGKKFAVETE